MTDIPKAASKAAAVAISGAPFPTKRSVAKAEAAIRAALPHLPGHQEPIIAAVERILDECSAWLSDPNHDVARRIALAAGIAVMTSQSERRDRTYDDGFAAGQEAMRTDLGFVLAGLRRLEECTGETLEGVDAVLIRWIEADLEGPALDRHPDAAAVDRFAAVMKAKLARKRAEGRSGWSDKSQCSRGALSRLLLEHIDKGDPVDVANFAMMLHQRGESIAPAPSPWRPISEAPKDGTVTARDEPGDTCPNCAVPLWRVTEREARNEMGREADELWQRAVNAEALAQVQAEALKAARALVTAPALSGVRVMVAGWNGEGREDGPLPRHPPRLGARIETNCGRVYDLDERMTALASALAKIDALTGGEAG